MWARKVIAILLLGLFVVGTIGVADARNRPPLEDRFGPRTLDEDPDEDPWSEVNNNGGISKIFGAGNSFEMIFIGNIPVVVKMEAENTMPLLKAKRGK